MQSLDYKQASFAPFVGRVADLQNGHSFTKALNIRGGFVHPDVIFEHSGSVINCAGGIILVLSCFSALFNVVLMKIGKGIVSLDEVRLELGQNIIFALEVLVAADVIDTLTKSAHSYSIDHLYKIALIVMIRTVLAYFLDKELQELAHKVEKRKKLN